MTSLSAPAAVRAEREIVDEDLNYRTPGHVSWAIATGTAPLPFLGVYAVLFLVHGLVHPVSPPDITDSRGGETLAGFIALALFVIGCLTLSWFANRRRRWPFLLAQLATLATALDFLLDDTKGGRGVAFLLVVTSLVSLVLALHPASWRHVGLEPPALLRRGHGAVPAPVGGTADVAGVHDVATPTDARTDAQPDDRTDAPAGRYVGRRRAGR